MRSIRVLIRSYKAAPAKLRMNPPSCVIQSEAKNPVLCSKTRPFCRLCLPSPSVRSCFIQSEAKNPGSFSTHADPMVVEGALAGTEKDPGFFAALRMTQKYTTRLLAGPHWFAFFQKCADSFLRVERHGVLAHYFFRVGVGFFGVQIDLFVKSALADSY